MMHPKFKTKVLLAMETWQRLQPRDGAKCCQVQHNFGTPSGLGDPKPDDRVCPRELAWRFYVRARDQNPGWPFLKQEKKNEDDVPSCYSAAGHSLRQ